MDAAPWPDSALVLVRKSNTEVSWAVRWRLMRMPGLWASSMASSRGLLATWVPLAACDVPEPTAMFFSRSTNAWRQDADGCEIRSENGKCFAGQGRGRGRGLCAWFRHRDGIHRAETRNRQTVGQTAIWKLLPLTFAPAFNHTSLSRPSLVNLYLFLGLPSYARLTSR